MMFRKRRKNIFQKLFFNQYFLLALVFVLLILVSIPLARNVSKKYKIDTEVQALEDEIANLQKKNIELENLIEDYSSTDFVEEIARLNLGLKKEGEEVVVVNKNIASDYSEPTKRGQMKFAGDYEIRNPQKWLKHFFK